MAHNDIDKRKKRPKPKTGWARRRARYNDTRAKIRRKRDQTLAEMGFPTYSDYTNSAYWRAFRWTALRKWNVSGCVLCGESSFMLHHLDYARVGRERPSDVIPLCILHHERVHAYHHDTMTSTLQIAEALRFVLECSAEEVRQILEPRRVMRANGE